MACKSSGVPAATLRRKGGCVVAMARSTSSMVRPGKGGWPVSTLNITLPKEKTSDAAVSALPAACSGDA